MNTRIPLFASWTLATLLSAQQAAAAPSSADLRLQALAATCANCHGTQGRAIEGSAVPGLAGLPASYLADQMRAFKQGSRPATVMHQLAKGYTDAQIDALAGYFATRPR